jgi:hypothetical protein
LNNQGKFIEELRAYSVSNAIKTVVIASQGGKTALKLAEKLGKEIRVISISEFTYSDNNKKKMKKLKIMPIENADLPIQDNKQMREMLLIFDSGIKAALEVASIATAMELVRKDFITIAGSGNSLDTALVISSTHPESEMISEPLKKIKVKGILASPLIA